MSTASRWVERAVLDLLAGDEESPVVDEVPALVAA